MSLRPLSDRFRAVSVHDILTGLLQMPKYKQLIPDMVRSRLNDSGTYSTGQKITTYSSHPPNVYAYRTIDIKKEKGQTSSRVTLKDTGEFQSGFALKTESDTFSIEYEDQKPDGKVSDNVDLDNVFNLSQSEMNELRAEILPDFITALRNELQI